MTWLVWASKGFESHLQDELKSLQFAYKNIELGLFEVTLNTDTIPKLCWAIAYAPSPQYIEFKSISEAQKHLKGLGKVWSYYPVRSIRRGHLISEGVQALKPKLWHPFIKLPTGKLGCFSLLSDSVLMTVTELHPSIPPGSLAFHETSEPPSKAYLKLWEALTILNDKPTPSDSVLELGSSPGGWTWVLAQQIGCHVTCLDRGEMDKKIISLPNVKWHKQDAFSFLQTAQANFYQWLFSDMACDPSRLLTALQDWTQRNPHCKCICTIKLTDKIKNSLALIREFEALPQSYVVHLNSNKHELTWVKI